MANMIKTDKTGQHCMVRADINNHSVLVECKCLGIKPSYGSVDYILEPVLNPGETISVRDRIVRWLPVGHDPNVCDNCQNEYFDSDGNQVQS
jgi:hypothetical protein